MESPLTDRLFYKILLNSIIFSPSGGWCIWGNRRTTTSGGTNEAEVPTTPSRNEWPEDTAGGTDIT